VGAATLPGNTRSGQDGNDAHGQLANLSIRVIFLIRGLAALQHSCVLPELSIGDMIVS